MILVFLPRQNPTEHVVFKQPVEHASASPRNATGPHVVVAIIIGMLGSELVVNMASSIRNAMHPLMLSRGTREAPAYSAVFEVLTGMYAFIGHAMRLLFTNNARIHELKYPARRK